MTALNDYKNKKMKGPWSAPALASFAQNTAVLSFDQSLGATGWVYLLVRDGKVDLLGRDTLRTKDPEGVTGWRASFARARAVRHAMPKVDDFLSVWADAMQPRWPEAVVLEQPPVSGYRTESSMMAAYEIDAYAQEWWRPTVFMSIQRARTILGGSDARNDKKAGHKALVRYIPESETRQWNEHQRDAAINALGHLYELNQEESR